MIELENKINRILFSYERAEAVSKIALALKQAVEEEQEKCRADVCSFCDTGDPIKFIEYGGLTAWCHVGGGINEPCKAQAIRNRGEGK